MQSVCDIINGYIHVKAMKNMSDLPNQRETVSDYLNSQVTTLIESYVYNLLLHFNCL